MRFLTNDGRFGFLVAPLAGRGMFRFQVILDGQLIGDSEPCILGTAMKQLANRPHVDDARLGMISVDTAAVISVLRFDEEIHDATTVSLAESLDRWLINAYMHEGSAVMLAQACPGEAPTGRILTSVVEAAEYCAIVDAVRAYWSTATGGARTGIVP